MFTLVFVILLFLIGLGLFIAGTKEIDGESYHFRAFSAIPIVVGFVWFIASSVNVVDPGNVAVPVAWGKAGTSVGSGIHLLAPWTDLHSLSVQTQEYTMSHTSGEGSQSGDDSVSINTKDQAQVGVDSTVIFRLDPSQAKNVYVKLGGSYIDKIVRPTIREAIRAEGANYDATTLATSARQKFADTTQSRIESGLKKYGIIVQDVKIRDISLPQQLRDAVDQKIAAQQSAEKQQFILQEKQQQAQQRVVEAKGLADAQAIIQSTLTPGYLQFEYIDAMKKLAGSPNTTFLFVPNDPNNLPSFQLPLKK